MRTQSQFAAMTGLLVAVTIQASACRPSQAGVSFGGERCMDGEICKVVPTATSVQSVCVRDDGNDAGSNGCGSSCPIAVCGDGVVAAGEKCDGGNAVDFDGCKNDCTVSLHTYIKASDIAKSDVFGLSFGSILALSADGSTLAVGAFGESSAATGVDGDQSDNSAGGAGAAYVFTRSSAIVRSRNRTSSARRRRMTAQTSAALITHACGGTNDRGCFDSER